MAGMGEGVEEQVLIREAMVQRRFRPFQQCVQNVRPMRSQRIAEIQVQGFSHSADPSVEKNMIAARPPTFSDGTKPKPQPLASVKIGRAHVCTPVTNAQLVCRLPIEKTKSTTTNTSYPLDNQ